MADFLLHGQMDNSDLGSEKDAPTDNNQNNKNN